MKTLLAAVFALISATASAAPDMWVKNNDNGSSIVLIDTPCIVDGKPYYSVRTAVAYEAAPRGQKRRSIDGCWVFQGRLVFVKLNGGADGYIPRDQFIPLNWSWK